MTDTDCITLTPEETELAKVLVFRLDHLEERGSFGTNAEIALRLTKSLLDRNGIPDHRRRYFTDPDYNPGGRGRSNRQIFERNGCRGDDILRHAHFLPYLRYFLYGADLPKAARGAFRNAVKRMEPITSGDLAPLGKLARKLARDHRLAPHEAREEFYKLALDCGIAPWQAEFIRRALSR